MGCGRSFLVFQLASAKGTPSRCQDGASSSYLLFPLREEPWILPPKNSPFQATPPWLGRISTAQSTLPLRTKNHRQLSCLPRGEVGMRAVRGSLLFILLLIRSGKKSFLLVILPTPPEVCLMDLWGESIQYYKKPKFHNNNVHPHQLRLPKQEDLHHRLPCSCPLRLHLGNVLQIALRHLCC